MRSGQLQRVMSPSKSLHRGISSGFLRLSAHCASCHVVRSSTEMAAVTCRDPTWHPSRSIQLGRISGVLEGNRAALWDKAGFGCWAGSKSQTPQCDPSRFPPTRGNFPCRQEGRVSTDWPSGTGQIPLGVLPSALSVVDERGWLVSTHLACAWTRRVRGLYSYSF